MIMIRDDPVAKRPTFDKQDHTHAYGGYELIHDWSLECAQINTDSSLTFYLCVLRMLHHFTSYNRQTVHVSKVKD